MRLKSAIDYGVYLVVRLAICMVQALSIEACLVGCRMLGFLFSDVLRIRRAVVEENLRHAYPDLTDAQRKQMTRQMWEHLFLMVVEIAHAPRKVHRTNWQHHIRIKRIAEIGHVLLDDRPTVIVSAHFGNFELGGYALGLVGFPTVTVARTLDNPYLDRFLNRFRGTTGQYMVPKQDTSKLISGMLDQGASLALLGDQAAGPKGCWVNFFGRPASAHKAIAVFSLAHNSPLVVTGTRRLGRPMQYETGLEALADPQDPEYNLGTIPDLTQWYTDCLATLIDRSPEQYWWIHRRWKGEPPQRKSKKKAA